MGGRIVNNNNTNHATRNHVRQQRWQVYPAKNEMYRGESLIFKMMCIDYINSYRMGGLSGAAARTLKEKKSRKIDSRTYKDRGYVKEYIIISGVFGISELQRLQDINEIRNFVIVMWNIKKNEKDYIICKLFLESKDSIVSIQRYIVCQWGKRQQAMYYGNPG